MILEYENFGIAIRAGSLSETDERKRNFHRGMGAHTRSVIVYFLSMADAS